MELNLSGNDVNYPSFCPKLSSVTAELYRKEQIISFFLDNWHEPVKFGRIILSLSRAGLYYKPKGWTVQGWELSSELSVIQRVLGSQNDLKAPGEIGPNLGEKHS